MMLSMLISGCVDCVVAKLSPTVSLSAIDKDVLGCDYALSYHICCICLLHVLGADGAVVLTEREKIEWKKNHTGIGRSKN